MIKHLLTIIVQWISFFLSTPVPSHRCAVGQVPAWASAWWRRVCEAAIAWPGMVSVWLKWLVKADGEWWIVYIYIYVYNIIYMYMYTSTYIYIHTYTSRRGENRASGCSIFAILCGWRCGPVAILWSDNCSKIPGIFKVHFNDVLVFTGENVFRARRFLIVHQLRSLLLKAWPVIHFWHCFAIATGKLLLLAAALGWLSHWCVCSNCYG